MEVDELDCKNRVKLSASATQKVRGDGLTWLLTCSDTSAQPEGKNVEDGKKGGGETCFHHEPNSQAVRYKRDL